MPVAFGTSQTTPSLFGTAQASPSLFGTPKTMPSIFGAAQATPSLFGTPKTTPSMFGKAQTPPSGGTEKPQQHAQKTSPFAASSLKSLEQMVERTTGSGGIGASSSQKIPVAVNQQQPVAGAPAVQQPQKPSTALQPGNAGNPATAKTKSRSEIDASLAALESQVCSPEAVKKVISFLQEVASMIYYVL